MRRSIQLVAVAVFVVAIAACRMPFGTGVAPGDAEPGTGTLVLTLEPSTTLVAKTIEPDLTMVVATYDVRGYGPGGAYFEQLGTTSATVVETSVALGDWVISVDGFNVDGDRIATGTTNVVVGPSEVLNTTVSVTPVDGTGTLDVSIDWPSGILTTPAVEATLTPAGGSATPAGITLDSATTSTLFDDTLDDGYYILSLTLRDQGDIVWSTIESVRIIADEVSSAVFSLIEDINRGGFEVQIVEDLGNPATISFNVGDQASITVGGSVTVVADTLPVDPGDGSFQYQWYLAGQPLAETTNSVVVGSGLTAGMYWLDLIVTTQTPNGFVLSSGRTKIAVGVDGSATATAFSGDVIVVAPPGALPAGTALAVSELVPADYPGGLGVVGGFAFDILPPAISYGVDAQIIVRYNDTELPPGIGEADLTIIEKQADGSWMETASAVDTGAMTVSAYVAQSGSYALAVRAASVVMQQAQITPLSGETVNLYADVFDSAGTPLLGRTWSWTSDNPSIASVPTPTTVVANSRGTTYVRVTSGSAVGVTQVVVHVWLYTYTLTMTVWDPHVDFDSGTDEYRPNVSVWINGVGVGSASFSWDGNASDSFGLSWSTGSYQSYSTSVSIRVVGGGYEEDGGPFDPHDYFTTSDSTFGSSGAYTPFGVGNTQFTWSGYVSRTQVAVP